MITNQFQFLPRADNIIFLEDGKITAQGHFEELMNNNEKISKSKNR